MKVARCLLVAGACAGALLAYPADAHAQPRSSSPSSASSATSARQRALALFERSAVAYREGRFQDAVDLLKEARTIKAEPVLLYDLGRAYEALGSLDQAADSYAAYLAEDPRAADRRALEIRIETLRSQAGQLEKSRAMPPPEAKPMAPEPPPPPPPAPSPTVLPWILGGVGIAGLGTGVVLALAADGKHRSAEREPTQTGARDEQRSAESLATGATIAFIAGAILTAAGASWLTLRFTRTLPAHVAVGPGSARVEGVF